MIYGKKELCVDFIPCKRLKGSSKNLAFDDLNPCLPLCLTQIYLRGALKIQFPLIISPRTSRGEMIRGLEKK